MFRKIFLLLALSIPAWASATDIPPRPPSYSYVDDNGYVYDCKAIRYQVAEEYTGWVFSCRKRSGTIVTGEPVMGKY